MKFPSFLSLSILTFLAGASFADAAKITEGNYGFGLENDEGKLVLPCIFDKITQPSATFFPYLVELKGKFGFVDNEGIFITGVEFEQANPFRTTRKGNYLAEVRKKGAWNFIDCEGVPVFVRSYLNLQDLRAQEKLADFYLTFRRKYPQIDPKERFLPYTAHFTSMQMNQFFLRGEAETDSAYRARTNPGQAEIKMRKVAEIAQNRYLDKHCPSPKTLKISDFSIGKFDATNATVLISHPVWGNFVVPVPNDMWRRFSRAWKNGDLKITDVKSVLLKDLDYLRIKDISFYSASLKRTFKNDPDEKYSREVYTASIDSTRIADAVKGKQSDLAGTTGSGIVAGSGASSDVDRDIPAFTGKASSAEKFAFIVAIEDYGVAGVGKVHHALNDGYIFKQYCGKTLGVPEENIVSLFGGEASGANLHAEINAFCKKVARAGKKSSGAEIIFYYAGHGVNDSGRKPYLVPYDVSDITLKKFGICQEDLFKQLASTGASKIAVFLDACFSGQSIRGVDGSRGIRVVTDPGKPVGQMVVFSATDEKQEALPYADKAHGIFTYFLLKKLQESAGNVTLGELSRYLEENVSETAYKLHKKDQRPTATASVKFSGWEEKHLH